MIYSRTGQIISDILRSCEERGIFFYKKILVESIQGASQSVMVSELISLTRRDCDRLVD